MLAATKVKLSGSKKKKKKIVNKNTYDISFIKRVTWKFLEVSRCSRAKKTAKTEMYKKVCCTCNVVFLLIRPIVVFLPFSLPYTILYFV